MIVSAFVGMPLQAVGYLVGDDETREAFLVDAPCGTARRFTQAVTDGGYRPVCIVLTHGHWEQFAAAVELAQTLDIPVLGHSWDGTRLADPSLTMDRDYKLPVAPCKLDRTLGDGEVLQLAGAQLTVLHTPGHSPGSICLYAESKEAIFTGGLLLRTGVGSTRIAGGNAQQLEASLRRLSLLPDKTAVYPGYGAATTIGKERWLLDLAGQPAGN